MNKYCRGTENRKQECCLPNIRLFSVLASSDELKDTSGSLQPLMSLF